MPFWGSFRSPEIPIVPTLKPAKMGMFCAPGCIFVGIKAVLKLSKCAYVTRSGSPVVGCKALLYSITT
jgi:hypothetical protein